mmetsp:Transcript_13256/g.20816  ORF Transcript_13256/g.20816 Transcript_13256/m.20816 type:complete len:99 (+) Transcript_13256:272-568(+)
MKADTTQNENTRDWLSAQLDLGMPSETPSSSKSLGDLVGTSVFSGFVGSEVGTLPSLAKLVAFVVVALASVVATVAVAFLIGDPVMHSPIRETLTPAE